MLSTPLTYGTLSVSEVQISLDNMLPGCSGCEVDVVAADGAQMRPEPQQTNS